MAEMIKCNICKQEKDKSEINEDSVNGPFPVCKACLEPPADTKSLVCEETGLPCGDNTSMPGQRCQCDPCLEYFKDSPF